MRLQVWIALLVLVVVGVNARAETREPVVADSAEEIRPLLIGEKVPDVTLVTPDHSEVALRKLLREQPTVLIYYRGGW